MAVAAAAEEDTAGAGAVVEGVAVEREAGEGALAGSTVVGRGAGVTPGSPYTQSHPSPAALAMQDFCLVFCA